MQESDDELVLQVIQERSRGAFGELTRRHQASVRSTLTRLTRNPALADDLAQETFIRGFLRIDQYRIGESFRAWLGGIAYREFLKDLRKQKTSSRHLSRLSNEHLDEPLRTSPDTIDLDRALVALGSEERTAVVLCYAGGMSHSEISVAMDAPLGTVKSWVKRGKTKLEKRMSSDVSKEVDGAK
jgi:RNA polymerase sigma-70 factor (ECF subfamily)